MRSALAAVAEKRADIRQKRQRSHSLSAVPPATTSDDYLPEHAQVAASILYKSPRPSAAGLPVYILNAAAFPDAWVIDYDSLLPYVLARLPGEDELLSGQEYEVVFFAGGQPDGATSEKKQGPGIGWYLQAYHVLSRATRKKLQKLYIVHPRTWVRVLIGVFGTVVSPKFRRKIFTINNLTTLAQHVRIEQMLIPPAVYLHDRKLSQDINSPGASGRRAFGAKHPLPKNLETRCTRLPRVLRETTSFLLLPENIATEGIFRVPPHSIQAGILTEAYDRGQEWIVWRDREDGQFVVQPGLDPSLLEEIRPEDTYGVHLAAALIKTWYRELREPIFPEGSYTLLRERYGDAEKDITSSDLVNLLSLASDGSPLTSSSREILGRHLLPLLSVVALNEPQNKMTPEALSICFAMALLCGSNQLEDARMTSVIKRVLMAAIESWPQLRQGLGIDKQAFENDLNPPESSNDYEDPLEKMQSRPASQNDREALPNGSPGHESHQIKLVDDVDEDAAELPPPLPPRRSRAPSSSHEQQQQPQALDTSMGVIPKRKPAPVVTAPPRYSSIFDTDGASIHTAESPASYAPVDGFGPPRRGDWSIDGDLNKVPLPSSPTITSNDTVTALYVPKRKALSNETPVDVKSAPVSATASSDASSTIASARVAAQFAASGLAKKLVDSPTSTFAGTAQATNTAITTPSNMQAPNSAVSDSAVFRKPSWPASATTPAFREASGTSDQPPSLPARYGNNTAVPIIKHPAPSTTDNVAPVTLSRPRAPSPGLMKRMATMEPTPSPSMVDGGGITETVAQRGHLRPRSLNPKRTSVDDLRRLYEERANTAESLRMASQVRRGSSLA